jgi:hypothetical protein
VSLHSSGDDLSADTDDKKALAAANAAKRRATLQAALGGDANTSLRSQQTRQSIGAKSKASEDSKLKLDLGGSKTSGETTSKLALSDVEQTGRNAVMFERTPLDGKSFGLLHFRHPLRQKLFFFVTGR